MCGYCSRDPELSDVSFEDSRVQAQRFKFPLGRRRMGEDGRGLEEIRLRKRR